MFKTKFIISLSIFVIFLTITSIIKNETRLFEKEIFNLNKKISIKKKNINEAQLEYYYLSSPEEIEKKINVIGFNSYKPIPFSKIFFNISNFNNIEKKLSKLKIQWRKQKKIKISIKKVFILKTIYKQIKKK